MWGNETRDALGVLRVDYYTGIAFFEDGTVLYTTSPESERRVVNAITDRRRALLAQQPTHEATGGRRHAARLRRLKREESRQTVYGESPSLLGVTAVRALL